MGAGIILQCDPLAVLSASGADQIFENHTGTATNTRAAKPSGNQTLDSGRLSEEAHRKFYETNDEFSANPLKLMSPAQVLSRTDLTGA
ncbi:MAG: hypothetical protein R6V44_00245 [Paracoccaceae bacterium]